MTRPALPAPKSFAKRQWALEQIVAVMCERGLALDILVSEIQDFLSMAGYDVPLRSYADVGAALPAEHAPPEPTHPPWEVQRTYTRPMASTDTWGPGPYFVVRRGPGEWCACSLVEERAIAVRDALNAVANGAPLTAQISKLVGDINNVFAPRIRELLAENDKLRAALPPQTGNPPPLGPESSCPRCNSAPLMPTDNGQLMCRSLTCGWIWPSVARGNL